MAMLSYLPGALVGGRPERPVGLLVVVRVGRRAGRTARSSRPLRAGADWSGLALEEGVARAADVAGGGGGGLLAEVAQALRAAVRQQVAHAALGAQDLAGRGDADTALRGLVALHLGHDDILDRYGLKRGARKIVRLLDLQVRAWLAHPLRGRRGPA